MEFFRVQFRESCFLKSKMLTATKKYINSVSKFKHFEPFWNKTEHFYEASISIIFPHFRHHYEKVLQTEFIKCHILCGLRMTKKCQCRIPLFLFLIFWTIAWFSTHSVFEFFSWHINSFSTTFRQLSSETCKWQFTTKKLSKQERGNNRSISSFFPKTFHTNKH